MPQLTLHSNPVVDGSGRLSRRAWGTLLVLCGALFLDALDVSMIGVALPVDPHRPRTCPPRSLQWVVSAYVLGYGGFLLLGGRAADLLGRRRMFLISLGVFVVASGLGGLVDDGSLLIATRFIKGVSAAFTAPAGLSIITTSFAEGPARNQALAIYTATGATGFSLGLVFGGLLTEIGWRWVFFLPVPVALVTLLAAIRLVPDAATPSARRAARFDLAGAVDDHRRDAAARLHASSRRRTRAGPRRARSARSPASPRCSPLRRASSGARASPLVRLGILRSAALVRANLGAMALFGGWVGFQFIATLYMQQLRGWSPLETGLAIFPGGLLVAVLAPRIAPLIGRFGVTRLIVAGLTLARRRLRAVPARSASTRATSLAMLPTLLLAGLGFAPRLRARSTSRRPTASRRHEQGLAGGLLNTSFQFGGALVLAVVTAVDQRQHRTRRHPAGTARRLPPGHHRLASSPRSSVCWR